MAHMPVHIPPEEGARASIGGSHIRVILSTHGIGVFDERTDPRTGPPLHIHHDADEIFRVIEGHYRFRVGDETVEAGPGDVLTVPKGAAHTFVNAGDAPGQLYVVLQPGGAERFFRGFAEKGLALPRDMAEVVALGQSYELEFAGPNPFLEAS